MESDLISWLCEQIVGLVLAVVTFCLQTTSIAFKATMNLSASMDSDSTLDLFFQVFIPNAQQGNGGTLWNTMLACGLVILYGILIFQLFKGLFGPIAKAESPIRLLGRSLLFAILVVNARGICQLFFYLGTAPYNIIATAFTGFTGIDDAAVGGLTNLAVSFVNSVYLPTGWIGELIQGLLSIIFLFSIVVNYVKLMVEIVERYVILGVLSFFSPLCIATGASENTNQIFKSWIKMMISQCILMCMSVFFLSIFEQSVLKVSTLNAGVDGFIVLLMLLAWLRTGQRIDSHMSTLGLSVAQSGGGLWGDMFAGAALMNAVANPGNTALGRMANTGMGIAQAGGLRAFAGSQEGAKVFGGAASRIARATNSDAIRAKSAAYDTQTNPWGLSTGQNAMAGIKGKYGDVADASGKTLNDRLAEGHSMLSGTMTGANGQLDMLDANGNAYKLAWGDKADGSAAMSATFDNDAARNAYFGTEAEGEHNAAQMADATAEGGAQLNAEDAAQIAEDAAGDAQNVDGQLNADGTPVEGTTINDGDGNALGVSDGEGNMLTGAAMVEGSDGNLYDVSGASIDENGNFVDADGNVMTDENGNALSVGEAGGAMVTGSDGEQYDVSGATINDQGQFVDADGNVMTDANGNALSAEGIQAGTMMTDADGNVTDISSAMDADGNLMTNDAGNLVDAQGNELQDANGNSIAASSLAHEGAAIAGASGLAALNADGSFKTNSAGNIVDAAGNELKGANGQPISASSMSAQQTLMQGPDGKVSNISSAVAGDGSLRTNAAGNLVNASGQELKGANGQPIAANSIAAQAAFVSGPNGITNVNAAMGANGKPMTNAAGNLVDSSGKELKDSKGQAIPGNSPIQSGVLAKGADGQLHNVTGANLDAKGNFVNSNGQVMTDSNGKAISASGMAVTAAVGANGATNISSAVGANGQLMTNSAGNLVNSAGQELKGANGAPIAASSVAQSGVMVQGANGQMHNISSAIGGNGQLMTNSAGNLVNSAGQELKGANGAPIAASSLGGVVSQGAMTTGANGQTLNVTGASMSSSGTASMVGGGSTSIGGVSVQGSGSGIGVNSAGNLVNASGQEITGANGAPIAAAGLSVNSAGNFVSASGQEITGSNGAPIAAAGVTSYGAQKTIGTDASGNSYDISGAAFTSGGQPMTNSAGNIVNASGQEIKDSQGNAISGSGMSVSHAASIGNMAMDSKGQMHDISGSINSTGTGINPSAITHNADGSSYIKASDGTMIPMNGNQVVGGTYAAANGFMQSNASLQATPSNVSQGTPTYNASPTGNLAFGSDGQMHSISNSQDSSGKVSQSAVRYDSQGSYISADDGARIAVNGSNQVSGGTFTQASGTSGDFAITTGAVPVSGGHVESGTRTHAGVTTYNEGGSLALGGDGKMHDISSSLTPSGSVQDGAIRSDSNGSFVIASDGARINLNDAGAVAGGTYSQAAGNSGTYAIGHDAQGNASMAYANGNLGVFSMSVSDSSAVHQTYDSCSGSQVSSGDYIHHNGQYKQIYSGAEGGGRDANGNVQRYAPDGHGGYEPSASGGFVKCSDGKGGSSFVNTGAEGKQNIQTYNQGNSYFEGLPMTQGSNGSYNVGFGKDASVSFDGNGRGQVNLGNGHALVLTQKAADTQPPQGAYLTTSYNGKEYYAQPVSQAGAGINNLRDFYNAAPASAQNSIRSKSGSGENAYTGGISENARFYKHPNGVMTVVPDVSQKARIDDKGNVRATSYFPTSALDPKQAYSSSDPNAQRVKIGGREYLAISSTVNMNRLEPNGQKPNVTPDMLKQGVRFQDKYQAGGRAISEPVRVRSTSAARSRQQNARVKTAKTVYQDHSKDIMMGKK